jgi:hypothetical protein
MIVAGSVAILCFAFWNALPSCWKTSSTTSISGRTFLLEFTGFRTWRAAAESLSSFECVDGPQLSITASFLTCWVLRLSWLGFAPVQSPCFSNTLFPNRNCTLEPNTSHTYLVQSQGGDGGHLGKDAERIVGDIAKGLELGLTSVFAAESALSLEAW